VSLARSQGSLWLLVLAIGLSHPRGVHAADPNLAYPTRIVTVQRDGYSIAGMATHLEGASKLKYGIALFAGSPGILRLHEEDGQPRYAMAGNFLIRSRRHWLDEETLVLAVDAPSDEWGGFQHAFRETERYGQDVAALLKEAGKRYGIEDWTFVGTSEGAVSAFHAGRMNPELARRVILTASLFLPNRNGRGLSGVDLSQLKTPLLWVHHADDPCRATPYSSAREFARRSSAPLVTVRGGGPGRGPACEARTSHGFVGVEPQAVQAMRAWAKTGKAPGEVAP
jgi:predicted esterase